MANQTDDGYLREIANTLSCHRGLIVEKIVQMQRELKDALLKIKLAKEALK